MRVAWWRRRAQCGKMNFTLEKNFRETNLYWVHEFFSRKKKKKKEMWRDFHDFTHCLEVPHLCISD